MAANFNTALNVGGEQHSSGFRLHLLGNPSIVLSHIAFRTLAIFFYVFAYFFTNSFIVQFLIILFLLSVDFWLVKNITGRLLVGLRWWNFVDMDGKNHWRYESAKDTNRFDPMERRIFWGALVVTPILWFFFVCIAFVTFKWEWMMVAFMGLTMSLANMYGYIRCKWSSTQEFSSYISKLAFLSMLQSNRAQQSSENSQVI